MKLSRAVLQQCVSARLLVKPATDEQPADYVEVSNGVVIFICFMKGANSILIPKLVKCLLEIKLSYCAKQNKRVSILELPGDILIVPQATLGGKVKGKVVQYHNNIDKEVGEVLYQRFVDHVKEVFEENRIHLPNECSVKNGHLSQHCGFCGTVVFAHVNEMAAGFHMLKVSFDESSTNGHTLFIKRQNVKNDPKNDYTLFVVNLPPYCGKIGLENIFSECGEIKSILIKDQPGPDEAEKTDIIKWLNKEKYVFKVAYILFKETESVETALEMSSAVVRYMSTESKPILSGIKKWIHEYKNRYPNENTMQNIIDTFMKDFDQNNIKVLSNMLQQQAPEKESQVQPKKDNNEPDDEGWTTIPVKKSASTEKPKLTRKMKKKEKKERIEKELMNFYVFQQREIKRDQIAELRRKFEEDKKRIAMLRQQRKFKPF